MKLHTIAPSLLLLCSVTAQGFVTLPSTTATNTELPQFSLFPFMQPNSRVQMFYDATEFTTASVIDQLEMRWDGPIPQVGAPGPFAIQQLTIRVGTTSVPMPSAGFEGNLTQPLTTVFSGPWSYLPDDGSAFPHPWGGTGGTLTFPFAAPVVVALNPGEWFVVDVTMVGNNIANFGFAHAILDGVQTTGGITNGGVTNYGQGCSAGNGQPAASATVTGTFAPGAAHSLSGQNLGANAPVAAIFGFSDTQSSLGALPFVLPGTNCTLLVSPDVTVPGIADATGAVPPNAFVLSLPANASLNGASGFQQLAALAPAANPFGFVLSNAVRVDLGSFAPLGRGTYSVAHDTSATAPFANQLRPFGYALRLRTL